MKLLNINNMQIITACQYQFGFRLPSELIASRTKKLPFWVQILSIIIFFIFRLVKYLFVYVYIVAQSDNATIVWWNIFHNVMRDAKWSYVSLKCKRRSCKWPWNSFASQSLLGLAYSGGAENDGPSKLQRMKLQDMNLQDMKGK